MEKEEKMEREETAESLTEQTKVEPEIQKEESVEQKEQQAPGAEADPRVAELESKLEETENRYLRLQADFDNFRRRSRMDLEASAKYRAQSLISDLLPALDNFERAMKMEVDNDQAKSLLQGMEMVYRGILDAFKKEGAEPIEAEGKEFDPHKHQAVMQVQDESVGSNIVVEEFQRGYILKDRVIRPSMVKVNQ
ncbi:nucleotide exchange factor GrpE [Bacillus massilinigeriensis]|uniref:nucleotide exchange factor GrpE n=1 Tax=Bacillus mediterraneensis TaxID=1805474 RepID=UPI0008F85C5C|nr:nucleotide exchange factor GrpE [Bacillus mediterraneensis]